MKNLTTWILAAVAVGVAALAWWQGGLNLALTGLLDGGKVLLSVVPLLIAAFLIAGLINTLVSEDMIQRWLGSASGWRGIVIGCVAGALIPGGPYVYYPIAAALLSTGASLGVLVAFITAKNLYAVTRLPLEFGLLGPRLTLIRMAVTLVIPPLLGFVVERVFGGSVEHIRENMPSRHWLRSFWLFSPSSCWLTHISSTMAAIARASKTVGRPSNARPPCC